MKCCLGLYYSLVLRCEMTKSTKKIQLHQPIESQRMELKQKIRTFETEWSICKQSSKKGGKREQCETVGKQSDVTVENLDTIKHHHLHSHFWHQFYVVHGRQNRRGGTVTDERGINTDHYHWGVSSQTFSGCVCVLYFGILQIFFQDKSMLKRLKCCNAETLYDFNLYFTRCIPTEIQTSLTRQSQPREQQKVSRRRT